MATICNLSLWLALPGRVANVTLYNVDAGQRGVIFDHFRGTHFFLPEVQKPIIFHCRSCPRNVPIITGSKDLQNVDNMLRILVQPVTVQLLRIYTALSEDNKEQVLPFITTKVIKSMVGHFDAGELITQREEVFRLVNEDLVERAAAFRLTLDDVSLTHLNFSANKP